MNKKLSLTILTCICVVSTLVYASTNVDIDALFGDYTIKFKKEFGSSPTSKEYQWRKKVFTDNYGVIQDLNKQRKYNSSAWYGVTKFSDLTHEEFLTNVLHVNVSLHKKPKKKKLKLGMGYVNDMWPVINFSQLGIPNKVDWRVNRTVTAVKNQASCGACWAFSTVETVESMYAIKHGVLKELSVQQVMDCITVGSTGCRGGDICLTSHWLRDSATQLLTEKEYPLTMRDQPCASTKSTSGVKVNGASCNVFRGNEDKMLWYLANHGPLVAAVDATSWRYYLGGIIHYHCDNMDNHAVQIVGYDLTGDTPYYIVRNTWGADFGNHGYLYISVGNNMCGLAEEVAVIDVE